jgi:hypothetical protein
MARKAVAQGTGNNVIGEGKWVLLKHFLPNLERLRCPYLLVLMAGQELSQRVFVIGLGSPWERG